MSRRWLSVFLVFAVAWLATPNDPNAAEHPLTLTPELKVQLAELKILRGVRIDPPELAERVVLVSFFASWCAPCRKGFSEQRKLLDRFGQDRIKIIAVNWFEDIARYPGESSRLTRLMDRIAPGIAVVEGGGVLYRDFGSFRGLPAVFAFDPAGREIYRFVYRGGSGAVNADYQGIATLIEARSD